MIGALLLVTTASSASAFIHTTNASPEKHHRPLPFRRKENYRHTIPDQRSHLMMASTLCPPSTSSLPLETGVSFLTFKLFQEGTTVHASNAVLGLIVAWIFKTSIQLSGNSVGYSRLSVSCMFLGLMGLVYDNAVNSIGKFIGPGTYLRQLSKGRIILHSVSIPMLFVPVMELARAHSPFFQSVSQFVSSVTLCSFWAFYELVHWWKSDIRMLKKVDLRRSQKHQRNYLAGTLAYSVGAENAMRLIGPCVALLVFELFVGCSIMLRHGLASSPGSGVLLAIGSFGSLLSCSFHNQPSVQLLGENFNSAMLCASLLMR